MQVTINVVSLPEAFVTAYLDAYLTTIGPILNEEELSPKVAAPLLRNAVSAVVKSMTSKHLNELDKAGMFNGVTCIDYPGFVWTRAAKRLFAFEMLIPSVTKTLAEDLAAGRRDLKTFMDALSVQHRIAVDCGVEEAVDKVEGPLYNRLCEFVPSIMEANYRGMEGITSYAVLRALKNVSENMSLQVDDVLVNLQDDLDTLLPTPIVYL